jgi:hypothetical protein
MSSVDLIKFLTYQSEGRQKQSGKGFFFSCGLTEADVADRMAVQALIQQGSSAVPSLEGAIRSASQKSLRSEYTPNFNLLLYAYAKIHGSAAFPLLRTISANPPWDLRLAADSAVALSLDLTSYVPSSRPLQPAVSCKGRWPRDTLDQLIAGWEEDNRKWVEGALGEYSRTALTELLRGKSWEENRADLWQTKSKGPFALGYRFEIHTTWSEPALALEIAPPGTILEDHPILDTHFVSATGADCGRLAVNFVKLASDSGPTRLPYAVNQRDIGGLLRVIGLCAAQ